MTPPVAAGRYSAMNCLVRILLALLLLGVLVVVLLVSCVGVTCDAIF